MEIERKFLVPSPPPHLTKARGKQIRQGYFSLCSKNVEIRLRQIGSEHVLTIKAGQGKVRIEEELPLSKQRFQLLRPLVRDAWIVKTRYKLPCNGHVIELDVYQQRHRGLITADVEFKTLSDSRQFKPPAWFGREVTGNRKYANETLAHRN